MSQPNSHKPAAPRRAEFVHFTTLGTRWADNDVYGHVNNVVYYAFFDTAVNRLLIERGVLDLAASGTVGLVVETQCTYFASIAFPDAVQVGLRVEHLGTSSVRYALGVFRNDEPAAAALGRFVHVYVDRASQRPVPIPADVRAVLEGLRVA
jgi:acyl-CoA thioester hydrolase